MQKAYFVALIPIGVNGDVAPCLGTHTNLDSFFMPILWHLICTWPRHTSLRTLTFVLICLFTCWNVAICFFRGAHEIGLVPYTCRNYTCGKAQQVLNISNTANITHSCLYLHFDMATGCDISFRLSITYLNHIGSTWIRMAPWKRTLYLLKLSACWRCEPSWKKFTLHRAVAHCAKSAFLWEE